MSSLVFVATSEETTIDIARILGECLEAGDSLILSGDLGAGKTRFTKGLALGMGVKDAVASPTFTIACEYEGSSLTLYHYDLYRLDDPAQLEDTGIFDAMGEEGVCVIEWGDRFAEALGEPTLFVELARMTERGGEKTGPAVSEREIILQGTSLRGEALLSAFEAALAQKGYRTEKS